MWGVCSECVTASRKGKHPTSPTFQGQYMNVNLTWLTDRPPRQQWITAAFGSWDCQNTVLPGTGVWYQDKYQGNAQAIWFRYIHDVKIHVWSSMSTELSDTYSFRNNSIAFIPSLIYAQFQTWSFPLAKLLLYSLKSSNYVLYVAFSFRECFSEYQLPLPRSFISL